MNTLIALVAYVLGFVAVTLTIGFVAWLFVVRYIWIEHKKFQSESNEARERIKKSQGGFGKPSIRKLDL